MVQRGQYYTHIVFNIQSLSEIYLYYDVTFISTLEPFEEDTCDFGDECSLTSRALREALNKSFRRLFIL